MGPCVRQAGWAGTAAGRNLAGPAHAEPVYPRKESGVGTMLDVEDEHCTSLVRLQRLRQTDILIHLHCLPLVRMTEASVGLVPCARARLHRWAERSGLPEAGHTQGMPDVIPEPAALAETKEMPC